MHFDPPSLPVCALLVSQKPANAVMLACTYVYSLPALQLPVIVFFGQLGKDGCVNTGGIHLQCHWGGLQCLPLSLHKDA